MNDDILIIEDSGFFVRAYSKVLTAAGYRVLVACDGQSGIATAEACHPSLIILDLLIPGMTGIDVLRALKQSAALCDIPVLVVSSLSEAAASRVILEGAVAFCRKNTLTAEALQQVVDEALRKRVLLPERVAPKSTTAEEPASGQMVGAAAALHGGGLPGARKKHSG